MTEDRSTLYDRIGGEPAVMAAVDLFYQRMIGDPLLAPFFDQTDLATQTRKMVSFMTRAFGGPDEYRGRDLRAAHAKPVAERGLGDVHFDATVEHLRFTLVELAVLKPMAEEALALVASTRDDVLNR